MENVQIPENLQTCQLEKERGKKPTTENESKGFEIEVSHNDNTKEAPSVQQETARQETVQQKEQSNANPIPKTPIGDEKNNNQEEEGDKGPPKHQNTKRKTSEPTPGKPAKGRK